MRWQIANEACRPELAITISYPTSASGIIVLLKNSHKISIKIKKLNLFCNKKQRNEDVQNGLAMV